MTIIEAPKESQSALTPVLFDPEGEVLTTNRLNVFVDEGRPMLNNYFRHVQVGWGQHGDVYLCHKVNVSLPVGHPERRIPVVRALSLIIIILFHNLIYQLISFFFFLQKNQRPWNLSNETIHVQNRWGTCEDRDYQPLLISRLRTGSTQQRRRSKRRSQSWRNYGIRM